MFPQAAKLGGIALDLLFPKRCIGCGKEGEFICSSCRHLLPRIQPPLCPKCGRPQSSGILCPSCINWQAEIDGIRSPFRFDGVIRQAVYQLKYRNLRAIAPYLAMDLNSYLARHPVPVDAVVPVPLHRKRLKERGYNQSGLLARALGRIAGIEVIENSLIRTKHASPQARTTNVLDRQKNVSGAFGCRDDRLKNRKVLLIDDVSTSGATFNACAAALKTAGASSVWGLALTREI